MAHNADAVDFAHSTRHFRVPNPARFSDADALSSYDRIRDDMVAADRLSRDPVADRYHTWRRHDRGPYLSANHDDPVHQQRCNAAAGTYGAGAGPMPAGAVLAKDSFTVTRRSDVFTAPLFLMEKTPAGFSAETRDWRYTMIMPDGALPRSVSSVGRAAMASPPVRARQLSRGDRAKRPSAAWPCRGARLCGRPRD